MSNYIKDFQKSLDDRQLSKSTIASYMRDILKFIQWLETTTGSTFNGSIDNDLLQTYIKEQHQSGIELTSINRYLRSINYFNRYLYALGQQNTLDISPMIKKIQNDKKDTLNREEINRLKEIIYQYSNKMHIAMFLILLNTGIKVSEMLDIQIDDVILEQDDISYLKIRPIGRSMNRDVLLNDETVTALKNYWRVRPITICRYYFLAQDKSMARSTVFRMLKKYSSISKIKDVGPNTLRNTFIRSKIEEGIDLKLLTQILGYSSEEIIKNFTY